MKGRSPLVVLVSDPTLPTRRFSLLQQRALRIQRAARLESALGGDGATRPVTFAGPRLDAARVQSRVDAAQAEASAALKVPLNRAVTWCAR